MSLNTKQWIIILVAGFLGYIVATKTSWGMQ